MSLSNLDHSPIHVLLIMSAVQDLDQKRSPLWRAQFLWENRAQPPSDLFTPSNLEPKACICKCGLLYLAAVSAKQHLGRSTTPRGMGARAYVGRKETRIHLVSRPLRWHHDYRPWANYCRIVRDLFDFRNRSRWLIVDLNSLFFFRKLVWLGGLV